MRAILCDHFAHYSELKVTDIPRPKMTDGTLRLAIKYATVGFGTSLLVAGKYQRKPPLPFVPGTEVSGVVVEVGCDVQGFVAGDRVVASLDWGGFAEEAIATPSTTWHVPDDIALCDAVSVSQTFGTSYAALHWRARIKEGETLVVFGAAGGVGLTAVQVGRLAGARVIAVAGSKERARLAVERGAHVGLVHGAGDLGAHIKEANDGSPVDIVFDPVGQPLFDQALRCVRPEGRILLIGFASGQVPSIPANLLLVKNIDVIGFNFGLYVGWGLTDERETYRQRMKSLIDTLMHELAAGRLKSLDHTVYPIERFADAFDSIVQRRSTGRAVLSLGSSADS